MIRDYNCVDWEKWETGDRGLNSVYSEREKRGQKVKNEVSRRVRNVKLLNTACNNW